LLYFIAMDEKFKSPYRPEETEARIYKRWEDSGYFNPDKLPARHTEPWCTIMPPPNANGRLHAGHGLDMTLKDLVTRFKRMQGKKALFLPGADHAGFETQMVFEKKLAKEDRSRFQMTDEELYKEIYAFTMENKQYMESDLRRLGTSCDWSRNAFTLDPEIVAKVQETFLKMHNDGLVYRGERIVNWNPKFQTSLSDVETEFVEKQEPFYYFQYGPFVIGTSRPETKFGDKHVVVHPDDERYAQYTDGQQIELEWINGPITATVLKDAAVDTEFGTGAMTITPWHDAVDFDIAERRGLPKEQVIDFRGKLLPIAGEFAGMKIDEARAKIVEKLRAKGLLVKVEEEYKHNIRICSRTKVQIEPQVKAQWFVKMAPLAEMVLNSVEKNEEIALLPDHQKKILLYWMHNTIDWNISRQIVWGIPIPAWFRGSESHVGHTAPEGDGWVKDTDTFDTWFSSGQWPLLTLGFPDGADFKTYYPTDLMETGADLVFKWVPRMIMFGLYLSGKVPFKTVYFHGMVNDAHNQKMSKSKGNVVSPLDMADKFGMDALRMALVVGNPPGSSVPLSEDKIKAYKHFANKLWNIARFVFENCGASSPKEVGMTWASAPERTLLSDYDAKLLAEADELAKDVTKDMEEYRFYMAAEKLYHYAWDTLAGKILEESKPILSGADEDARASRARALLSLLDTTLRLLHPFMPFVTEEIWSALPKTRETQELLMIAHWPA
jgi:valyl-tRNA synthetase